MSIAPTDLRRPRVMGGSPPPPNDLAAEAAVLSAVMLKCEALARVAPHLRPDHFYSDAHRWIYTAALGLAVEGQPIDPVTISSWLRARERLEGVGGINYVTRIVDATPAASHIEAHAASVVEKWRLRQVIAECQRIAAEGYGDTGDAAEWLDSIAARVAQASDRSSSDALPFLSMDELLAPPSDPTWVVRGLGLCVGRPNLLVGPGASAKSLVAQTIALSVACGQRLFGQFFCEHGNVVHVDWEMGPRTTLHRYRRLALGLGMRWEDVTRSLKLASLPKYYLNQHNAEALLTRAVAGSKLCILDSLRRSVPGVDENSSEISRYLDPLTRVSEATGCAFLVIHHATTKAPEAGVKRDRRAAGRGSSAIFDAAGAFLVMDGASGEPPLVTLEREPQAGTKLDPFHIRVDDVELDGDPKAGLCVAYLTPEQVDPTDGASAPAARFERLKEHVVAQLRESPAASKSAIAVRVRGRKTDVLQAIEELRGEGRVAETGGMFRVV